MKISEFINDENFLSNLGEEQFKEVFDLEAVAELENTKANQERIFLLSQWLVGNVSEPFNEIKKLDKAEQWRVLDTWFDLIKDADTLKQLAKSVIHDFIRDGNH